MLFRSGEAEPMYIEINKDMTKILTPEEGHPYASQYADTTTVKDRLDFMKDGFAIKTSTGAQAMSSDEVTALKPTLELYKKDGITKVDGTSLIKDLAERHYIIKATFLTASDPTHILEADYSITINNLITDKNYDKEITSDREVYRLATGPGECDLPTVKQAWYALTFGKEKKDYNVSGYAYPYFVNTSEDSNLRTKLCAGLGFPFLETSSNIFLLAAQSDKQDTLEYDKKTYEKLDLQGVGGSAIGSKLGLTEKFTKDTQANYLLVKNPAPVVNP